MHAKRFWREMPTTAFKGDISNWIAVLPVAAIEQHGPHLPVGVDALIGEGMVARSAAALPDDSPAVFLPLQEICKSNEHLSFPGTVSLDWDSTIRGWLEIGDSVARAGVRKILIITSHGGNVAPMEIAARELRCRHDMLAVTTTWGRLGDFEDIYASGPVFTDIHGGNAETSMMLALRPDLVDMTKAENFASAQTDLKGRNKHLGFHSSNANIAWMSEDLNAKGTVGDASAATAENGEREIASEVAGFCELILEIAATEPPGVPS